jgi:hypothetical protein
MKHVIPILLLHVACGSPKVDRNICAAMLSCEEDNCTPGDDHCAFELDWELNECLFEMDHMRAETKHSGCESEWSGYLSCIEREQYCETDDDYDYWTYNYAMCELEETVFEDCMADHARTHDDTGDTSTTDTAW